MPRQIASIVPLLLVLASPSWAQSETAAPSPQVEAIGPEPRVALEDGVPVRSEPGFVHRELHFLSRGQEVVVDGRMGRWLHVRPEGWIYEEHLVPLPDLEAQASVPLVVTQGATPVREQPAADAASLRSLALDEVVRGKRRANGWWELDEGGFVAEGTVREPVAARGASDASWVVGPQPANVRAEPNTQAPVVRKLAPGDSVAVSSLADGWCRVPGGFIRADLLVPPEPGVPAARPASDASPGSARRWSLVDLEGTAFEITDIGDSDVMKAVRAAMRAAGLVETDWTYLGLTIGLPEDASYRFNFDPSYNTLVIVDDAGQRYGNKLLEGPMARLPMEVREFFLPLQVNPGEQSDSILLFLPALEFSSIREISMFINGRLQRFYSMD